MTEGAETLTFDSLCLDAARRFVQTAIVVDNEAGFGPPSGAEVEAPRRATIRRAPELGTGAESMGGDVGRPDESESSTTGTVHSHYLDMKALGDAFLSGQVVCGVYRPGGEEEMVPPTIKAASTADIVIIDWQLEGPQRGSAKAKEVVTALLRSDQENGPRLRLIAIYTGQKDLNSLAAELLGEINKNIGPGAFSAMVSDASVIIGEYARLVFINKSHTVGIVSGDRVATETELPAMLLAEYACLARGILPATAMAAIADIRHATPHVLTVFRKELDGAYVGHRAMIPLAEDSEPFLRRLITEELDTVVETAGTISRWAGSTAVDLWLSDRAENGYTFTDADGRNLNLDTIQHVLNHVSENPESYEKSVVTMLMKEIEGSKGANKRLFEKFTQLFYDNGEEQAALLEFSRLCNIKREHSRRSRFEQSWVPVLSLGTVIRPLADGKGQDSGGVKADDLLLCVQPRCDSVRIAEATPRKFPFLILAPDTDMFQYVMWVNGASQTYRAHSCLYETILYPFSPRDAGESSIKATKHEESFIFTDQNGAQFEWVADIKELPAQHAAAQLGARAASVGYDEHEWLRLNGK